MEIETRDKAYLAILLIFLIWVGGGFVYTQLEDWSWIDSLYFAATTITTVGYGHHIPSTDLSKSFTMAYMFGGIALVLYSISLVGRYYGEKQFEEMGKTLRRFRRSAKPEAPVSKQQKLTAKPKTPGSKK